MPVAIIGRAERRIVRPPEWSGVNWDSPQAQGLAYWWPLHGRDDLLDRVSGALLSQANTATTDVTDVGRVTRYNGSDVGLFSGALDASIAVAPITIVARGTLVSGSSGALVSIAASGSNFDYYELLVDNTSGGRVRANARSTASGYTEGFAGLTGFGATEVVAGAVFSAINHYVAYANGIPGTPVTTSVTPAGINRIGIGALARGGVTDNLNGRVWDVRIYRRALSQSEMRAIYEPRSRFDLYWMPSGRKYVFLESGGGFQAAWAAQANVVLQVGR